MGRQRAVTRIAGLAAGFYFHAGNSHDWQPRGDTVMLRKLFFQSSLEFIWRNVHTVDCVVSQASNVLRVCVCCRTRFYRVSTFAAFVMAHLVRFAVFVIADTINYPLDRRNVVVAARMVRGGRCAISKPSMLMSMTIQKAPVGIWSMQACDVNQVARCFKHIAAWKRNAICHDARIACLN